MSDWFVLHEHRSIVCHIKFRKNLGSILGAKPKHSDHNVIETIKKINPLIFRYKKSAHLRIGAFICECYIVRLAV